MKRRLTKAKLERILRNPTLHPEALLADEAGPDFPWHKDADKEHSSQVFCLSAFGTLRHLRRRDRVVADFLSEPFPKTRTRRQPRKWHVFPEQEQPDLLNECGRGQSTSIDALLVSNQEVISVEAKFKTDANQGFGTCSQVARKQGRPPACQGFYGPGSDRRKKTKAWCRLENWDGTRSPRLYWSLGKAFFQPDIFQQQQRGDVCPFNGPNYQLMRNFLFAAAYAQRNGKGFFGVLAICPEATSDKVKQQIEDFRRNVLLPPFQSRLKFVTYERYIEVLRSWDPKDARELAGFLEERIRTLIG